MLRSKLSICVPNTNWRVEDDLKIQYGVRSRLFYGIVSSDGASTMKDVIMSTHKWKRKKPLQSVLRLSNDLHRTFQDDLTALDLFLSTHSDTARLRHCSILAKLLGCERHQSP